MTECLEELAKVVGELLSITEQRDSLMRHRDELIRAALDSGATWVQVQSVTGLSPRGLSLAINRQPKNSD
ncbi:hypothetical protein GCM10011399_06470 [Subtercola lobariae]|uniref:Uncharacterized protein n=1 Tax=Subtercola lobariae TaxID=1588641 RepID=A0A917B0L3_9MICO|nr:hypothetical protein GCM10011399_06470 [Subtercola lobariae]